jgi:acyl-CoA thioesterase-2
VREEGLEHQIDMPDVPAPDDLPSEQELKEKFLSMAPENIRRYWERERPIEMRPVDMTHYFSKKPLPPQQYVWVRASGPLPDDERMHQCVLAYASDMTLLDTSLFPHGTSVFSPKIQAASLDHAMWFHRPFRADEWLLYATDSTSSSGSRGMNRGSLFTRDGILIASTAQEGLIRLRKKD